MHVAQQSDPGSCNAEVAEGCGVHQFSRVERPSSCARIMGRMEAARQRTLTNLEVIRTLVDADPLGSSWSHGFGSVEDVVKRLDQVRGCARHVDVRDFYTLGRVRVETIRCRQHLLCQPCAIARGSRVMSVVLAKLHAMRRSGWAHRLSVLTLTVKDGPDLVERFNHLRCSRRKLLNRRKPSGRWKGNAFQRLAGGVHSTEIVRGRNSGLYHVHDHAIVAHVDPLPVESHINRRGREVWRWPELEHDWRRVTGDSFIVECHPLKLGDDGTELGAVAEVSKYALKFSSMEPADLLTAWHHLRGRNLSEPWGAFRGVDLEAEEDARDHDRLLQDVHPHVLFSYRWRHRVGYSVQATRIEPGAIPF